MKRLQSVHFITISSKLRITFATTVQAASSLRSAPSGAVPSGLVAIVLACSGDCTNSARDSSNSFTSRSNS